VVCRGGPGFVDIKLPLEYVVRNQSHDTAELSASLPAGGRRLMQHASGYAATMVSGVLTRRDGVDAGARPERVVRGAR
jgi:N-acyl-D-amino-acid deacylase